MPMGTTSYFSGSSAARTLPAVMHEMECSVLRPPNRTATRNLLTPGCSSGSVSSLGSTTPPLLGVPFCLCRSTHQPCDSVAWLHLLVENRDDDLDDGHLDVVLVGKLE